MVDARLGRVLCGEFSRHRRQPPVELVADGCHDATPVVPGLQVDVMVALLPRLGMGEQDKVAGDERKNEVGDEPFFDVLHELARPDKVKLHLGEVKFSFGVVMLREVDAGNVLADAIDAVQVF